MILGPGARRCAAPRMQSGQVRARGSGSRRSRATASAAVRGLSESAAPCWRRARTSPATRMGVGAPFSQRQFARTQERRPRCTGVVSGCLTLSNTCASGCLTLGPVAAHDHQSCAASRPNDSKTSTLSTTMDKRVTRSSKAAASGVPRKVVEACKTPRAIASRRPGPKARARVANAVAKKKYEFFKARAAQLRQAIFKKGWCLVELPRELRMGGMTARQMISFMRPRARPIFQEDAGSDGECAVGDNKRTMAVRDEMYVEDARRHAQLSKERLIERTSDFLKRLTSVAYGPALKNSTESLLLSQPSDDGSKSMDQSLHVDGDSTTREAIAHAKKVTQKNPPSLSVLVSFQGASVSVVHGSHKIVRRMSVDESWMPASTLYATRVRIPRNHALFFTQDLVHAGDGYAEDNLRYHMYLDHVDVPREPNDTYPLFMLFGEARAKMFAREAPDAHETCSE